MKLKPQTTILLSTLFVCAGILVTWATGLWQTESDKQPRKLETDTAQAQVQGNSSQAQYDPADIRGSYTFGEISSLYEIPLADLAAAFGVKEEEAGAFQVKSLKEVYPDTENEIGTASVRMFAAYYLGVAYTPSEESYLPEIAAAILKDKGRMTIEQAAYLESHTLSADRP